MITMIQLRFGVFSPHRTRRIWNTLLRLTISCLAIFVILNTVDVAAVPSLLSDADLWYLLAAILVIFLTRVLMAWKWQFLLHFAGFSQPFLYLLRIIFVSGFMGFFLPAGVGVDVIRTVEVGRRTGFAVSAISTIADRIMAIVTMTLCSSMAALIALSATPNLRHLLWTVVAVNLCIMVILALCLSKTALRTVQWFKGRWILNSESLSHHHEGETISPGARMFRLLAEKNHTHTCGTSRVVEQPSGISFGLPAKRPSSGCTDIAVRFSFPRLRSSGFVYLSHHIRSYRYDSHIVASLLFWNRSKRRGLCVLL